MCLVAAAFRPATSIPPLGDQPGMLVALVGGEIIGHRRFLHFTASFVDGIEPALRVDFQCGGGKRYAAPSGSLSRAIRLGDRVKNPEREYRPEENRQQREEGRGRISVQIRSFHSRKARRYVITDDHGTVNTLDGPPRLGRECRRLKSHHSDP
jgi:hypothetical protein